MNIENLMEDIFNSKNFKIKKSRTELISIFLDRTISSTDFHYIIEDFAQNQMYIWILTDFCFYRIFLTLNTQQSTIISLKSLENISLCGGESGFLVLVTLNFTNYKTDFSIPFNDKKKADFLKKLKLNANLLN